MTVAPATSGARLGLDFAADEQDLVERYGLGIGGRTVDAEAVAAGDFELRSAISNNRVHRGSVVSSRSKNRIGDCGENGGFVKTAASLNDVHFSSKPSPGTPGEGLGVRGDFGILRATAR